MRFLRTNTAVIVTVGPFYDKTDGVTIETALTITNERITLTADTDAGSAPTNILDNVTGATSGTANDLNYITGNDAGMMQLELAAADTNRLGRMFLSITDAANHVPVFHEFMVLPAMIFDAFVLGTDVLDASVTQLLGTAWLTPGTAGTPDVNTKLVGGTAQTGVDIGADTNDIQTRLPAALVGGRMDASTGAMATGVITAAAHAAGAIDAAAIATAAITAAKFAAGAIDAAAIATDAITAAKIAADAIGASELAADAVTEIQAGLATAAALTTVDDFLDTEIADIQARLPAALTAGGNMKSDMLAVNGSTDGAARIERAAETEVLVLIAAGSSTTSIIATSMVPTTIVNDQFNGRVMIFPMDTATTALRGQATTISDYDHATLTFTVVALTTAPASGDIAVIV
jgi:hypothetical protein